MKKGGSKRKGSSFELKICKQIAEAIKEPYGTMVRRTPGSGSLLCRADLWVNYAVRHKFNWFLELKKRENIRIEHLFKANNPIIKWYLDSKEKLTIDPEYDPMSTPTALVFARNNMMPFILMSNKDYIDMDIQAKYLDTSLKITFTNDGNYYVVLDWEKFLQIYTISA